MRVSEAGTTREMERISEKVGVTKDPHHLSNTFTSKGGRNLVRLTSPGGAITIAGDIPPRLNSWRASISSSLVKLVTH
jgi:hypothetical protein